MRDRTVGDTFYMLFTTRAFATGIPTALAGTPVVSAYEDNSLTQITAGITLGVDHDSVTGLNLLTIVATGGNGFESGKDYSLVITTGTVGGVSVVGEVVGEFSLELSAAAVDLANGTDGLTALSADIATAQTDLDIITGAAGAVLDSTATSAQLVDDVWDEVLTGGTHNVSNSSGKRLRQLGGNIFTDGTAQSGGTNSIQLAAGAITTDDEYRRARVIIVGGTGIHQEAIITSSVASTDTLTTTPAWLTTPDATSEYQVLPGQVHTTVSDDGYNGMIHVDTVNGTSGTEVGVNGTSIHPTDNLADAYAIAAIENITAFEIRPGSALTLPSDSSKKTFQGSSYTLALNGQEFGDSRVVGCISITGVAVNTSGGQTPVFERCAVGSVTMPPFVCVNCGFFGTVTLGSEGNFTFGTGAAIFDLPFSIDYGAGLNASKVFLVDWSIGEVEIQNAGAGTGSYVFEMSGIGSLNVNANCSATTTVTLEGAISRNADVAGVTYDEVGNVISILGAPAGDSVSDDIGALPTALENADTMLDRDMSAVVDTNSRSPLNALRFLRNKWSVVGTTLTVTEENDTTAAWTATVTTDAAADPITGSDPA